MVTKNKTKWWMLTIAASLCLTLVAPGSGVPVAAAAGTEGAAAGTEGAAAPAEETAGAGQPAPAQAEAQPIAKFDKASGLYGFVDEKGQWVIPPKFGNARDFREGLAAVSSGNARYVWGYIRTDGTYVVQPTFTQAYSFAGGLAVVAVQNKAAVIDATGQFVQQPKYDLHSAGMSDRMLAVISDQPGYDAANQKFGLITKQGALIEPQFDGTPFEKGEFVVVYHEAPSMDPRERAYGVALDDGTVVEFEGELLSVSDGMGLIRYYDDQLLARSNPTRRYAFISQEGEIYKSYKDRNGKEHLFLEANAFSEGYASVAINTTTFAPKVYDSWGFIGKDGTWLVEPGYADAGSFSSGIAPVRPAFSWGYINLDGTWFIEPKRIEPAAKVHAAFHNLSAGSYTQSEHDYVVQTAQSVLKSIIRDSMSDYEKLDRIYGYVTKHVKYDDNYYTNSIPRVSYTAYGALKYSIAVCEGYSELLSLMLNLAGIENIRVVGYIKTDGIGHAWNLVKIGGIYYHVDATWDAGGDRDYFLISDASMKEKGRRDWNASHYPAAARDYR